MAVVDKLDIRRAQVLIEAIIVDVSVNKNAELGVNWAVWSDDSDTHIPVGGFGGLVAGGSGKDECSNQDGSNGRAHRWHSTDRQPPPLAQPRRSG